MLPSVYYDRRRRVWTVAGISAEFAAGAAGKRLAQRAAVHVLNPKLGEMVATLCNRFPVLEMRAWRAAEIVLLVGVDGARWTVESQTDEWGGVYGLYSDSDGLVRCGCVDYVDAPMVSARGQRYCKHVLAFLFVNKLNNKDGCNV